MATGGPVGLSTPFSPGVARTIRIVLIEPRVWFRDCLAHALVDFLPDVCVEGANSVDDVVPGRAALLLIGVDARCGGAQLREAISTLRRLGDGSPIGVYLHADNTALARLAARLGVAGIVMPSASVDIAIASVRVMAAGGNFLPPELALAVRPVETDPVERLTDDRPVPTAAPRLESSPESLTDRELEVLRLLRTGRSNKDIAGELHISQSTVKVHLRRIMRKLGTTNRTEAALQLTRLAGVG
ncbi:MAG: response regulator transcription factor [Hyphomicrobiales bacterium]|nr:response regulator transcription factor [Hyphomicrobiales bacterium]